ncbi:hypothetical protein U1Q18_039881 [Sarracenia purpurea var. burkii]
MSFHIPYFRLYFQSIERDREREMAMEWSPASWGSRKTTTTSMIEQAKEELQILEAQHPNRFDYLKLDLKSFIHLLQSQHSAGAAAGATNPVLLPVSSAATTQGSSTRKKTRKGIDNGPRSHKIQRPDCEESFHKGRDTVEMALQRAQACLLKIQQFKTSF